MSGGGSEPEADSTELAASEIHDVLRNDRRRLVLERLRAGDGTETVSDLSEHIGAIEADESPPPRNVRQSVYVSLHQTHLPKLDKLGIIEASYESLEGRGRSRTLRLAHDPDAVLDQIESTSQS